MKLFKAIKSAIVYARLRRKEKQIMSQQDDIARAAQAAKQVVVAQPLKSPTKAAAVEGAHAVAPPAVLLGGLAFLRAFHPSWIPWSPEQDGDAIAALVVLGGAASTVSKFVRKAIENRKLVNT